MSPLRTERAFVLLAARTALSPLCDFDFSLRTLAADILPHGNRPLYRGAARKPAFTPRAALLTCPIRVGADI